MYERFTDRARKVIQLATQEANKFNDEYIGTEHILLGLVEEGTGVAANVIKNLAVDPRKIRLEVEKIIQWGPDMVSLGDSDSKQLRPSHKKTKQITARPQKQPNSTIRQKRKGLVNIPAYSDNARKVMLSAAEAMFELKNTFLGPEHILLGILQQEKTISYELLAENEISIQRVKEFVEQESFTDRNRNHDNIFQLTSLSEYVMYGAQAVAESMGASEIDVDHLLLGILEERGGIVISMLEKFGLDRQEIVGELLVRMGQ
ncbi:MAG: hypothetical protein HUJ26_01640 [Planctomycetaceae bacterium]|nr:hypothetical protein [Planctomycetaceae bacterium]